MVIKNQKDEGIPIVDMKNLHNVPFNRLDDGIQEIASLLRNALHEYGFVYMTNHGISNKLIETAFTESRKFFELPAPIKTKYTKEPNVLKNFHGYAAPGQELLNEKSVHELRENWDVSQRQRFYPTEDAPGFGPALESLENACRSFDSKLLKILALSLELPDTDYFCKSSSHLENKNVSSVSHLVTNYYPPLSAGDLANNFANGFSSNEDDTMGVTRCAEHTDWETITLLFQDDAGGLEIKTIDNQWIQAPPIPDTILVNIGDMLEVWTGGYFRATPHRVLVPKNELQRKTPRQSIAYFAFPDDHFLVEPLTTGILSQGHHHPHSGHHHFKATTAFENFRRKAGKAYGLLQEEEEE